MIDPSPFNHILGALAALTSAFFWAVAALLFGQIGQQMVARAINLAKGLVALACLSLFIFPEPFTNLTFASFWGLALSGLLGICIGDTLYLLSIQRLGARITLLIGALVPVVSALGGMFFFQEFIGPSAYLGLILTVAGVSYVLWNNTVDSRKVRVWRSGLLVAIVFVFTESAGILLTKWAVVEVDSLVATFIRQVWAVVGLMVWGLFARDLLGNFKPLQNNAKLRNKLLLAAFIGAFLGTWLSVLALKLTYATVAVALNSTGPIFILPIAIIFLGEKIPRTSLVGSVVAVMGVMIYFVQISGM